ncbi:MAG TPA: radical SAM protein, partial [Verrucomicrobiae bacterium]
MIRSFEPSAEMLQWRGEPQREFHEKAAAAARLRFGKRIFVRGVVEVSNFCRENCVYCGMRRDNRNLSRFRAHHDELAEMLIHHRPASITDLNIQAGEDPVAVREVVLPLIKTLRRETDLGISVCLGSLSHNLYADLKNAGASIYIIKFEIADPTRYAEMQSPGKYAERLDNIRHLAQTGWRVSSGFIAGLPGQTTEDMLQNLSLANELPLDGCSVSPFIPGDESPLGSAAMCGIDITLNSMAAMRL